MVIPSQGFPLRPKLKGRPTTPSEIAFLTAHRFALLIAQDCVTWGDFIIVRRVPDFTMMNRWSTVFSMCRPDEVIEEVFYQAMTAAYEKITSRPIPTVEHLHNSVGRILHNVFLNEVQKRRVRSRVFVELLPESDGTAPTDLEFRDIVRAPDVELEDVERARIIREACALLPIEQATVVDLILQGFEKGPDLAAVLDIPEPKARELKRNALAAIKPILVRLGALDYVPNQTQGTLAAIDRYGSVTLAETHSSNPRSL